MVLEAKKNTHYFRMTIKHPLPFKWGTPPETCSMEVNSTQALPHLCTTCWKREVLAARSSSAKAPLCWSLTVLNSSLTASGESRFIAAKRCPITEWAGKVLQQKWQISYQGMYYCCVHEHIDNAPSKQNYSEGIQTFEKHTWSLLIFLIDKTQVL